MIQGPRWTGALLQARHACWSAQAGTQQLYPDFLAVKHPSVQDLINVTSTNTSQSQNFSNVGSTISSTTLLLPTGLPVGVYETFQSRNTWLAIVSDLETSNTYWSSRLIDITTKSMRTPSIESTKHLKSNSPAFHYLQSLSLPDNPTLFDHFIWNNWHISLQKSDPQSKTPSTLLH